MIAGTIYLYFLKAKAKEILPLIYQRRLTGDILQRGYNQSIITNAISTRRRRELTQSESQKIVDREIIAPRNPLGRESTGAGVHGKFYGRDEY